MNEILIREATIEDAPEIAHVHLTSWRETYTGLMPQEIIDQLSIRFKSRMKMWKNSIESLKNHKKIWVADCQQNGIIGFSSVESARDERFNEYGELTCLYLLKAYHGKKIGYGLFNQSFRSLEESKFQQMYCWVLKDSPTINFYKKTGAVSRSIFKTENIRNHEILEEALFWQNKKN